MLSFVVLAGILAGGSASAQEAPRTPEGQSAPVPSGTAAVGSDAAPALEIVVKSFRFSGNDKIPTAELEPLVQGYVGQACNLTKLRAAADAVTDEYHKRGFDLAAAYLPVQEIQDGQVQIAVLEGKPGKVIVTGNTNYSTEFIKAHVENAFRDGTLRSAELEKALLVLNDYKDLKVSATLDRGAAPGTVDVKVTAEDRFPIQLTLFTNNFGTRYISRYQFGFTLDWTNAVLDGALLTFTGVTGDRPDLLLNGSGAYVVPINTHGTKIGVTGAYGEFQLASKLAALHIHGEQANVGVFVGQSLYKSRELSLDAEAGFQYKDDNYFLQGHESSHDRLREVYATLSASHVFLEGRTTLSLTLTQGLGAFAGGMHEEDRRASRFGADDEFTRLSGSFARLQPFGDFVALLLRASGQWTSDPLVTTEQWQLGGADSVRGYAPGDAIGDHGYAVNLELRVTPLDNKDLLALLAFFDSGGVFNILHTVGQANHKYLSGAGLGARSHIEWEWLSSDLRVDVGWPLAPDSNSLNEWPVLYFSASVRF